MDINEILPKKIQEHLGGLLLEIIRKDAIVEMLQEQIKALTEKKEDTHGI